MFLCHWVFPEAEHKHTHTQSKTICKKKGNECYWSPSPSSNADKLDITFAFLTAWAHAVIVPFDDCKKDVVLNRINLAVKTKQIWMFCVPVSQSDAGSELWCLLLLHNLPPSSFHHCLRGLFKHIDDAWMLYKCVWGREGWQENKSILSTGCGFHSHLFPRLHYHSQAKQVFYNQSRQTLSTCTIT